MSRSAIIFGASLVAACPATAADPQIAAYYRCVAQEGVRLSTGIDAANLIAENAAVLCGKFLASMLEDKTNPVPPKQLGAYEKTAIDEATLAILEARAKTK